MKNNNTDSKEILLMALTITIIIGIVLFGLYIIFGVSNETSQLPIKSMKVCEYTEDIHTITEIAYNKPMPAKVINTIIVRNHMGRAIDRLVEGTELSIMMASAVNGVIDEVLVVLPTDSQERTGYTAGWIDTEYLEILVDKTLTY